LLGSADVGPTPDPNGAPPLPLPVVDSGGTNLPTIPGLPTTGSTNNGTQVAPGSNGAPPLPLPVVDSGGTNLPTIPGLITSPTSGSKAPPSGGYSNWFDYYLNSLVPPTAPPYVGENKGLAADAQTQSKDALSAQDAALKDKDKSAKSFIADMKKM